MVGSDRLNVPAMLIWVLSATHRIGSVMYMCVSSAMKWGTSMSWTVNGAVGLVTCPVYLAPYE